MNTQVLDDPQFAEELPQIFCDKGRNYIYAIFIFFKSCANLWSVALSITKYLLHGVTCNIAEVKCNNSAMLHALPCNKYILSSCYILD